MTGQTPVLGLSKPAFNAVGWDTALNNNFDLLDAAVASSVFFVGYRGVWAVSNLYTVNDVVNDIATNQVFRCLITHTSPGSGTFAASRSAVPANWLLMPTSDAAIAAVLGYTVAAQASSVAASVNATTAFVAATNSLTFGTNALAFATAASISAIAAAASAEAAVGASVNARTFLSFASQAETTTDHVFTCPPGYISTITQYTLVAFTSATTTMQIGTTVGGAELVAPFDINPIGVRRVDIVNAAAPLVCPWPGGTMHVRIVRTVPTIVGTGRVVIGLLRS